MSLGLDGSVRASVDVGPEPRGLAMSAEGALLDTPSLRGLWRTAPYLHDGSAATLRDVVATRNPDDRHGVTGGLDPDALDDLLAYLRSL